MSSSKNHQEAHGIGQIEHQLEQQAQAAQQLQGQSEVDQAVLKKANEPASTLNK